MKQNNPIESVIKFMIIIAVIICILSSCKIMSSRKSNIDTKTDVHKTNEGTSKSDSTGNKKEYTKETFIYPGRDTIINNFIQSPGQPNIHIPAPVVYIKETGKEQSSETHTDNSWRSAFDSLRNEIKESKSNTSVKVGPSTIEIILLAGLGIVILKMFGPSVIKILSPIK